MTQRKRITKGSEFTGELKKICKAGKKQCYTTTIETKAAFAERTIGSLKKYFAVIWKIMATNTIKNHLNTSRHEFRKKLLGRPDTKEHEGFRIFVHSVQQATTRI